MRRLLPLAALLVAVLPAADAAEETLPASKSFGSWSGTCNNLGTCVAIGTAQADFFYVRITRDAGAAAPPQVKIVLATQDRLEGASPAFRLTAVEAGKTAALGPFPAGTTGGDDAYIARLAPGAPSVAFIDAIRNVTTLDYALLGAKGTLDLKGLTATLRWIDAKQGRAGTPTALVARGTASASRVPEPRKAPVVRAAAPGSVAEIDKPTVSQAVLRRAKSIKVCDADVVAARQTYNAWRFAVDSMLVEAPCLRGAYQETSSLFFTDAHGGSPRPVRLPPGLSVGRENPSNLVTGMGFDPKSMILSEFAKGRGIADCGVTRAWIWTGTSFELLDETRLDACPGALPDDWPNVYTAIRADR